MSMASELDAHLDTLFLHYGFYESEKLTKAEFKRTLLKDYAEIYLPVSEKDEQG